jgi:hypothetical protein
MSDLDHSPYDTAARDEATNSQRERLALELQNEVQDFQWLMSSKRGRRIVHRLLAKAGMYRSSFNQSGSVTAFNEGQRNVGLALMALIEAYCWDQYILLLQEKNS